MGRGIGEKVDVPLLEFIPIGRYINYFDMWNSFKEIKRRGDIVLPGHDPSVFDKPCYP